MCGKHRNSLDQAEATRTRLLINATKSRRSKEQVEKEKIDDSTLFSRWIGPSLRVLSGTALASANAAVG
jgi:hypothetical protein